jgi:multidrug efflux pump subunit AcrA (membrane-fusion protein)
MKHQVSTVTSPPAPAPLLADGLPAALQANGSPHPTPARPTKPQAAKKKTRLYLIVGALVLAACGLAAYAITAGPKASRTDLIPYTVRFKPLNLTVVERGALESADNREVTCRVKAGSKATALNIKWVIDDGAQVKAGDLLMEVDDSPLEDAIKAEKILLDQARAAWVASEEQYKITASQNESDIKTAEVKLQLARIDLKNFLEGAYPADLKVKLGAIKNFESNLEQQRDRAAWAQRMVKKGYQTASQAQAEQAKLESCELDLGKAREDLRVLTDPVFGTKKLTETDKTNNVAELERALVRTKLQAIAKDVQADSDRQAKKSVFLQEQDKYDDIEDQIRKCVITSPQDGMVVYFVSDQSRYGSGSSQSIIAQGEPVKEGQKLMRIPDLRRMLVNTKIHEAMVRRIQGEVWRPTGFPDALRATLFMNPDPISRMVNLNCMPEIRERFRDKELEKIADGMRATVRVDAFPERALTGHVKTVGTVASQQDWMSADVKVYQTMIAIDESLEGLKPGMSAEVTIHVESAGEHVLTVPIQAIVGGAELGRTRRVFVITPEGAREREITIGLSNETEVEVKEGLADGDVVVLNPKVMLGDKAKTRQPTDADHGPAGEGEGKPKGKGKTKPTGPAIDVFPKGGPPASIPPARGGLAK